MTVALRSILATAGLWQLQATRSYFTVLPPMFTPLSPIPVTVRTHSTWHLQKFCCLNFWAVVFVRIRVGASYQTTFWHHSQTACWVEPANPNGGRMFPPQCGLSVGVVYSTRNWASNALSSLLSLQSFNPQFGVLDLQSCSNKLSGTSSAETWLSSRMRCSGVPRLSSCAPENGRKCADCMWALISKRALSKHDVC